MASAADLLPTSSPPISSFLTSRFPIRLLLVRHGQSSSNLRPDLIAGRSDSALLTPLGELQATALSSRLHAASYRPLLVLSSTALRATSTASLLYPDLPLIASSDLLEQSQGQWTGQPRLSVYTAEVRAEMRRLHVDFAAPGGESIRQAGERALRRIGEEVQRWKEGQAGREEGEEDQAGSRAVDVLVVAHGMVIRGLVFLLCGLRGDKVWRLGCHNCSLTELLLDERGGALERLNDHAHAEALQPPAPPR